MDAPSIPQLHHIFKYQGQLPHVIKLSVEAKGPLFVAAVL
jgi:hypothetical protein